MDDEDSQIPNEDEEDEVDERESHIEFRRIKKQFM